MTCRCGVDDKYCDACYRARGDVIDAYRTQMDAKDAEIADLRTKLAETESALADCECSEQIAGAANRREEGEVMAKEQKSEKCAPCEGTGHTLHGYKDCESCGGTGIPKNPGDALKRSEAVISKEPKP